MEYIQYKNQQPSQCTLSLKTSVISDILPLWVWKIHASFNIERKELATNSITKEKAEG